MAEAVLIRALVAKANEQADALVYLKGIRDTALTAVLAGDVEVTSVSFEGGSGSGARKMNAQQLLDVVQGAIEQVSGDAPVDAVHPSFGYRSVQT